MYPIAWNAFSITQALEVLPLWMMKRVRVCVCVRVRVCVNAAQRICNSGQCFRLAFATPPLRPATKFVPMPGERLHAHVSEERTGEQKEEG